MQCQLVLSSSEASGPGGKLATATDLSLLDRAYGPAGAKGGSAPAGNGNSCALSVMATIV